MTMPLPRFGFAPNLERAQRQSGAAYQQTVWESQTDHLKKIPEALTTAAHAFTAGRASDNQLARLDDVAKTTGVGTIAVLGGMLPNELTPNALGAGMWLLAQSVMRWVVNLPVYLRTGINLDTTYVSSEGETRRLFFDPQYQPFEVLGPQKLDALYRRFNIPFNAPDRMNLLKDRIRQVQVQANTWWMLMTGLGTPMLAALLCDTADHVLHYKTGVGMLKAIMNKLKTGWAVSTQATPEALNKVLGRRLDSLMGQGSDLSLMAQWWRQTPNRLLGILGTPPKNVLHQDAGHTLNLHVFSRFLSDRLHHEQTRKDLQKMVTAQETRLNKMLDPLTEEIKALQTKNRLTQEDAALLLQRIALEHTSAAGTLAHLKNLFTMTDPVQIRGQLQDTVLANVYQALQSGHYSQAARLSGTTLLDENFARLVRQTNLNLSPPEKSGPHLNAFSSAFNDAFKGMGQTAEGLFGKALKSQTLHRQWLIRFPLLVGGFIGVSTAVYMTLFLGRSSLITPAAIRQGAR